MPWGGSHPTISKARMLKRKYLLNICLGTLLFFEGHLIWGDGAKTDSPWLADGWNLHAQTTLIPQWHGPLHSPYRGQNSMFSDTDIDEQASITATIYAGTRLWNGAEFYLNPEASGGAGFNGGTGIAGFTNGEVTRVGTRRITPYIARVFIRQSFNLNGDWEEVGNALNQLKEKRNKSRLTLTLGKVSVLDIFDNNAYAGDPRTQFMDWALMANGSWDYPADTRGYTWGFSAEFYQPQWVLRSGIYLEPRSANGLELDEDIAQSHGQVLEVETRHLIQDHPGKLRFMGYLNVAGMGNYTQALQISPSAPDVTLTRQSGNKKYGFGFNAEQELSKSLGIFTRVGWNDGRTETWAFTEIDQTACIGLSVKGDSWQRPQDTFAMAELVNGLSNEHRDYLAAGGLGFIIGDGQLNYAPENIVEIYYSLHVIQALAVTLGSQEIYNPAYNRDRGPVTVWSVRVHCQI